MKLINNNFDRDLFVNLSGNEANSHNALNSRLFDDLGNEYLASKITIANSDFNPGHRGSVTLVRGIPALAIFKFNKISPSANSLSLFKPGFISNDIRFQGDFRSFGGSFF